MLVAETLKQKNFSIVLWIKYICHSTISQLGFVITFLKKDTGKNLSTVYSFKGRVYRFYSDPATRLKGKLPKIK
jgi:hypothetical protein